MRLKYGVRSSDRPSCFLTVRLCKRARNAFFSHGLDTFSGRPRELVRLGRDKSQVVCKCKLRSSRSWLFRGFATLFSKYWRKFRGVCSNSDVEIQKSLLSRSRHKPRRKGRVSTPCAYIVRLRRSLKSLGEGIHERVGVRAIVISYSLQW